jgi:hypothetical protein
LKNKDKKGQQKSDPGNKQLGGQEYKNNRSKQKGNTHDFKVGAILLSGAIPTASKAKVTISRFFPVWVE